MPGGIGCPYLKKNLGINIDLRKLLSVLVAVVSTCIDRDLIRKADGRILRVIFVSFSLAKKLRAGRD